MSVLVTFAPKHSEVCWADKCFSHEPYILLEVDDIRHLITINIGYLYLLAVSGLEYILSLGVFNASCNEYVCLSGKPPAPSLNIEVR